MTKSFVYTDLWVFGVIFSERSAAFHLIFPCDKIHAQAIIFALFFVTRFYTGCNLLCRFALEENTQTAI